MPAIQGSTTNSAAMHASLTHSEAATRAKAKTLQTSSLPAMVQPKEVLMHSTRYQDVTSMPTRKHTSSSKTPTGATGFSSPDSVMPSSAFDLKNCGFQKSRRREQARRLLSDSLSVTKTFLPALRKTQSFNVASHYRLKEKMRDMGSLRNRLPQDEPGWGTPLRRTASMKETTDQERVSPVSSVPLSVSQPSGHVSPMSLVPLSVSQPSGHVNLSSLVHELNASLHHPSTRDRSFSDDSDSSSDDDFDDTLESDLFPPWARGGHLQEMIEYAAMRPLTPALHKLNKRRMPSRVRTQQWVNQIENCDVHTDNRKLASVQQQIEEPPVPLIFK